MVGCNDSIADALHATLEIRIEVVGLQEFAGAFQHHVATEIAPRDIAQLDGGAETELLVVDADDVIAFDIEGSVPAPADAVELQELRGDGSPFTSLRWTTLKRIAARGSPPPRITRPSPPARHAVRFVSCR